MTDVEHTDIVAANVHVVGYVQSGDPGAVGAGKAWIDTMLGTGLWVLKVRNAGDTGWESAGGGASGAGGASILEVQVFS